MTIIFNDEPDGSISALSFDAVWKGFLNDELYWSDVSKALGGWMVRWNDSYNETLHFETLERAKNHIIENYSKHTPHLNGRRYEL